MRPLVPTLALAALLLVPATQPGAVALPPLEVPHFRVGESATYEYAFGSGTFSVTYTVDALATTLDAGAVTRDVAVLTRHWSIGTTTVERVSLASMRVENELLDCVRKVSGQCEPWRLLTWDQQGRPGAWGAALVQGQSVALGDAWTLQGACRACKANVTVRVDAPSLDSPLGTAFVLNMTSPFAPTKNDRLHMGLDHGFPLLAQVNLGPGLLQYRLVSHAAGTGAEVPAPYPPAAPAYASALPAAVPFVGGRPVEGAPIGDHPTWAEARAAIGPDPLDLDPSLTLVRLIDRVTPIGVRVGSDVTPLERYDYVDARFAKAGGPDVGVRYNRHETRPLDAPLFEPDPWTSSNYTAAATTLHPERACAAEAPPLWDVARHGATLGLLARVDGYAWGTWQSPWSACEGSFVEVMGPTHAMGGELPVGVGMVGVGPGEAESIFYDAQSGLLVDAMLWPPALDAPL